MIATNSIDLSFDEGFNFYILTHLQEDSEKVTPEEEPQEESSSSKATISNTMPAKNFFEISAAKKRKRVMGVTSSS